MGIVIRDQNKEHLPSTFDDSPQNVKAKGQIALENVTSFQYLMYKYIRKTKSGLEKKNWESSFF